MKTIKVITLIDLLNKIANEEELPKKIRYFDRIWELDKYENDYYDEEGDSLNDTRLIGNLNDEVEIIEEIKLPKKINLYYHINNDVEEETGKTTFNNLCDIIGNLRKHEDIINSIIDYLRSKEKGE